MRKKMRDMKAEMMRKHISLELNQMSMKVMMTGVIKGDDDGGDGGEEKMGKNKSGKTR